MASFTVGSPSVVEGFFEVLIVLVELGALIRRRDCLSLLVITPIHRDLLQVRQDHRRYEVVLSSLLLGIVVASL